MNILIIIRTISTADRYIDFRSHRLIIILMLQAEEFQLLTQKESFTFKHLCAIPFQISPRGIEVSRTVLPTSVFKGHTVTLTCIFHGDEITFNSWKYGSNDLSSSPGTYAINTGSYDSTTGTLTTTVSFLIQDDPHTGESFECKGTYNADSAATTKLQTVVLKSQ